MKRAKIGTEQNSTMLAKSILRCLRSICLSFGGTTNTIIHIGLLDLIVGLLDPIAYGLLDPWSMGQSVYDTNLKPLTMKNSPFPELKSELPI